MPTTTAAAIRTCRILYYGPAGSGKRANLAGIQASLPAEHRLAVATDDSSRQIAFMLRNGDHGDWQVFVQAVDSGAETPVPSGQRAPFDGIVFVCDSRPSELDAVLSALEGLKSYLDGWRLDIMSVPMVLQYNRRDAEGVLPVDRLESLMNPWGLLSFPAVASAGEGVREPLKAILSLTISNIIQQQASDAPPEDDLTLGIDSNPPVPGTPHTPDRATQPASQEIAGIRPPHAGAGAPARGDALGGDALVIPVRVPRRALGPGGSVRLVLDLTIVED